MSLALRVPDSMDIGHGRVANEGSANQTSQQIVPYFHISMYFIDCPLSLEDTLSSTCTSIILSHQHGLSISQETETRLVKLVKCNKESSHGHGHLSGKGPRTTIPPNTNPRSHRYHHGRTVHLPRGRRRCCQRA